MLKKLFYRKHLPQTSYSVHSFPNEKLSRVKSILMDGFVRLTVIFEELFSVTERKRLKITNQITNFYLFSTLKFQFDQNYSLSSVFLFFRRVRWKRTFFPYKFTHFGRKKFDKFNFFIFFSYFINIFLFYKIQTNIADFFWRQILRELSYVRLQKNEFYFTW